MKRSHRYQRGRSLSNKTANRVIALGLILLAITAILVSVFLFTASIEILTEIGFTVVPAGLIWALLAFGILALITGVYSLVSGNELRFVTEAEYLDYYKNGSPGTRMTIPGVIILSSAAAWLAGWSAQLSTSDTVELTAVGFFVGMLWSYLFVMHRLSKS